MFKQMDESARLVAFVLGTDIDGNGHIEKRNVVLLIEEDPEPVFEDERSAWRGILRKQREA